jgi:hypothetical protein
VIERLVSIQEQLNCVAPAAELQWAIDTAPRLLAAPNPFDWMVIDNETTRAFPEAGAVESSRLGSPHRVIYRLIPGQALFRVVHITPHDYRRV